MASKAFVSLCWTLLLLLLATSAVTSSSHTLLASLSHKRLPSDQHVQRVRKLTHSIERSSIQKSDASSSSSSTSNNQKPLTWDSVCSTTETSTPFPLACAKLSPQTWLAPFAPERMEALVLSSSSITESDEEESIAATMTMDTMCLQEQQPCHAMLSSSSTSGTDQLLASLVQLPTDHACRSCIDHVYQTVMTTVVQPHVTETLVAVVEELRMFATNSNTTAHADLATQRADRIHTDLMPLVVSHTTLAALYVHHVVRTTPQDRMDVTTTTPAATPTALWITACCAEAVITHSGPSVATTVVSTVSSLVAYTLAGLLVFAILWGWQSSYTTKSTVAVAVETIETKLASQTAVATTVAPTATTTKPTNASTPPLIVDEDIDSSRTAARSIQSTWRRHKRAVASRAVAATRSVVATRDIASFATTPQRSVPQEVNIPAAEEEERSASDSQDSSLPDLVPQQTPPRHVVGRMDKQPNKSSRRSSYLFLVLAVLVALLGVGWNTVGTASDWDATVASVRQSLPPTAVSYLDEAWASASSLLEGKDEWYTSSAPAIDPAILRKKQWASSPKQLGGAYGPMVPF